jgi:hypothetical protein
MRIKRGCVPVIVGAPARKEVDVRVRVRPGRPAHDAPVQRLSGCRKHRSRVSAVRDVRAERRAAVRHPGPGPWLARSATREARVTHAWPCERADSDRCRLRLAWARRRTWVPRQARRRHSGRVRVRERGPGERRRTGNRPQSAIAVVTGGDLRAGLGV